VRDRGVSITSAVAHWVRSYRGRHGFLEHPLLTLALSPTRLPSGRPQGRGRSAVHTDSLAKQRSCLKSSSRWRVAV